MRAVLLVACAGCSTIFGLEDPLRARGDAAVGEDTLTPDAHDDASIDAAPGVGAWGTPALAFASNSDDDDPTLTADMLLMFFDRGADVWMTSRNATTEPWGTPTKVTELSTVDVETTPEVNENGLFITVASNRPNSQAMDIWWSIRGSVTDAWPGMGRLANVNSSSGEASGNMTADTLTFVFASDRPNGAGDYDLYMATRGDPGLGTTFDPPTRIAELSTAGGDVSPFIVRDGSEIYFDAGGDLFRATRSGAVWNAAQPITELNTIGTEGDVWLSADGHHMYFTRNSRIYYTTR